MRELTDRELDELAVLWQKQQEQWMQELLKKYGPEELARITASLGGTNEEI